MSALIGTLINAGTIIIGSTIGLLLKGGISKKISNTLMQGVALAVLLIGILGLQKVNNEMVVIISIAIGAVIGEGIDLEKWFQTVGEAVENKFKKIFKGNKSNIAEGFVTSSLLFCVGAMAITGALESGLMGKHTILSSKAILDGITSMVFASTMGLGVMLSSVAVFLYQGAMALGASFVKDILGEYAIADMTALGSLLIIAIGLNMLRVTKIKVANLLPAIFLPIIYYLFV